MTNYDISGTTRLHAIIADPIAQVKTPQLINALFARRFEDRVMVPMHVSTANLAATINGLRGLTNLDGFIVTVPHKTSVVALCDQLSLQARLVGAVNAVRRMPDGQLHGDILDGTGFVAGLRREGIEPAGLSVYLVGAGGAANAIAFALAEAGVARLTIANRTRTKAQDLVDRITVAYPGLVAEVGSRDPAGHQLVVNGTSSGLRDGDELPCDVQSLAAEQIVAEIIMQPALTPLLLAAQARGCRTQAGLPMLECQIELMAVAMGVPEKKKEVRR